MPVVSSSRDADALTLTIESEFAATAEQVWSLWSDPRRLERWWGPPTWPATFVRHEFVPGGQSRYYMTGPDGTKAGGWWTFLDIVEPSAISIRDGFAGEDGEPVDPGDYGTMDVAIAAKDGRTAMTVINTFQSAEQMQKLLDMGQEEGMKEAMGQIDVILADG
ncbi:SRPBCC domain-containing protein [Tsukamurella sp. 8F]|uniref:SRPBCC family protein n=1 Tax=unclassified Tsukamurella TaxID=2633480 RepID=UPI0023B9209D|nr:MULTISPECIES: SRPBCC domain-containing protein [unclassified Tsukamurella]MDF0528530.1 SRPBCC domain-containing protein [Tsukamurella sp. 8J]MDF0586356.1 SRPBCC domain-containing protein [Tsukamurella sp. 8F]